jgi:hypothetical protein
MVVRADPNERETRLKEERAAYWQLQERYRWRAPAAVNDSAKMAIVSARSFGTSHFVMPNPSIRGHFKPLMPENTRPH